MWVKGLSFLIKGRKENMDISLKPVSPPVPDTEAVIWADALGKTFDSEPAVQDVNLEIPPGIIFGFIGPSGCGKTTTIRLLTGVYTPSTGDVRVLGLSPLEFDQQLRARIGYMPLHFVLYRDLSVWENLNFAASVYGVGLGRAEGFERLLDFVELKDHRRKLVRNLSGGMQRRLSLAATLVHNPELLFLDEPTSGIDPVLRRKFWDHFRDLQEQGRTLFITTQYVSEAAYCDFVGIMDGGRLLMVETPEELTRRAFGGQIVHLRTAEPITYGQVQHLRELPSVIEVRRMGDQEARLIVDNAGTAIPTLMTWSQAQTLTLEAVEEFHPPFDDVFVNIIEEANSDA
jgi:ABC-2 type transport system ATP-binding protein